MPTLNGKQTRAAGLLARGMSCADTAKEVGVSPQTISAWKKDPEFEATVNSLKWEVLETARDQLRTLVPDAVKALQDLVNGATREDVRRKAAIDVLQTAGLAGDEKTHLRYGWGCGPETSDEIIKARKRKEGGPFAALLGDLY